MMCVVSQCHCLTFISLSFLSSLSLSLSADVKFIANPPSMIAAGSVAAAVQGLHLKSLDTSLSSQNLTELLSQIIKSDPVSSGYSIKISRKGKKKKG